MTKYFALTKCGIVGYVGEFESYDAAKAAVEDDGCDLLILAYEDQAKQWADEINRAVQLP